MTEAKKKVYVETSVVSNLTARPSHNPIDALLEEQRLTHPEFANGPTMEAAAK